jgi:hypothetical protein
MVTSFSFPLLVLRRQQQFRLGWREPDREWTGRIRRDDVAMRVEAIMSDHYVRIDHRKV